MYDICMPDEQPQQPLSVLDEAKKLNEELREKIEENKKLVDELNKARAEELLSGRGGQAIPEPKVEEGAMDYYKRVMANKL
jgi:hypothetical protein